jgi:predicted nucleic acid-binding protein
LRFGKTSKVAMNDDSPKIFADANVLIAGAFSKTGASYAVLRLADIGLIQLYVSKTVIDEAERNIRHKLPTAMPEFVQLLADVRPHILPDPPSTESAKWEKYIETKDAPILAAAVLSPALRLLTLNTKDFTPAVAQASGLIIQTPGEFIQNIRTLIQQNL